MHNMRATIVGIVVGVVALAVFVGFAVGLPKAEGDSLPKLPDHIGAMVAISAATAQDLANNDPQLAQVGADQLGAAVAAIGDNADKRDRASSAHLKKVYGGDAVMRSYLDGSRGSQGAALTVSVVKGEAGLVIPQGPAEIDSQQAVHYRLLKSGSFRCATQYQDAQPATTQSPATPKQYGNTECRTDHGGYTYDVYASGLSVAQVSSYLKSVLADA